MHACMHPSILLLSPIIYIKSVLEEWDFECEREGQLPLLLCGEEEGSEEDEVERGKLHLNWQVHQKIHFPKHEST